MITLDLSDELGPRHFEFLFVGFVLGGSMSDKKGIQLLRKEVALFEKLEAISELKPCGKKMVNREAERQLVNGAQLEISLDEADMLYNYLTIVPWQSGTPARHALEAIDWLNNGRHP